MDARLAMAVALLHLAVSTELPNPEYRHLDALR